MEFFSEDYLAHYGVKGMKWKKKKPKLPSDTTDPAFYEQYPSSWEDAYNMTQEKKKAMREHNKTAKKNRKAYNKQRKKVAQTTKKWAQKRGLGSSRRRSTDKITTPKGTGGIYPASMKPTKKTVKKRERWRPAGSHPTYKPTPIHNYSK